MLAPKTYPADEFYAAWRNVILYDEHTWGAHNSISQPDSPFVTRPVEGQAGVRAGRREAVAGVAGQAALTPARSKGSDVRTFYVFNTTSWPRTECPGRDLGKDSGRAM